MTNPELKETDPLKELIDACAAKTSAFLFGTFQGEAMRYGNRNLLNISMPIPEIRKDMIVSIEQSRVGHTFPLAIASIMAGDNDSNILSVWYRIDLEKKYSFLLGGVILVGKRTLFGIRQVAQEKENTLQQGFVFSLTIVHSEIN